MFRQTLISAVAFAGLAVAVLGVSTGPAGADGVHVSRGVVGKSLAGHGFGVGGGFGFATPYYGGRPYYGPYAYSGHQICEPVYRRANVMTPHGRQWHRVQVSEKCRWVPYY